MKSKTTEFALNSSQEPMCFLNDPRRKDLNICCEVEVARMSTRQLHEALQPFCPCTSS